MSTSSLAEQNSSSASVMSPSPMSSASSAMEIPDAFLCPITTEIMVSPVMTKTGLSFDRDAILEWLVNHGNTCPLTRQPLNASNLVTNHALRLRIEQWCREHDYELIKPQLQKSSCEEREESLRVVTCLTSAIVEQRRKAAKQHRISSAASSTTTTSHIRESSPSRRRARRISIFNILQNADVLMTSR
jgi:hypothetical protein